MNGKALNNSIFVHIHSVHIYIHTYIHTYKPIRPNIILLRIYVHRVKITSHRVRSRRVWAASQLLLELVYAKFENQSIAEYFIAML